MRKSLLIFILLASILLSGCLPETQVSPTASATVKASPVPTTSLSLPTEVTVPVISDCTVITLRPSTDATQELPYPPITAADWSEGPADARVTIVEYGDFQ
jgi:ABC-type Fe3+-hydroxamate transport system substrate-binding protein